jgi:hypothetical protein
MTLADKSGLVGDLRINLISVHACRLASAPTRVWLGVEGLCKGKSLPSHLLVCTTSTIRNLLAGAGVDLALVSRLLDAKVGSFGIDGQLVYFNCGWTIGAEERERERNSPLSR